MTKQMQVFNFNFILFLIIFSSFCYHNHQKKNPVQNIREHKNKKFVEINIEIVCVYLTKQIV
jgi:hypothetical protein